MPHPDRERYPGHPLKSADFKEGRVLYEEWKVKADYAWDTGVAIGTFLKGLKEGKLLGRRCNKCGRVMIPPRMFCELCFRPTDEWVELQDTGTVVTFSVSMVDKDVRPLEKPEVPAVIAIDGASENMGILHKLGEVGDTLEEVLQRVKVGLRVKAVWKPAEEREGAITDILYFKPLEEA